MVRRTRFRRRLRADLDRVVQRYRVPRAARPRGRSQPLVHLLADGDPHCARCLRRERDDHHRRTVRTHLRGAARGPRLAVGLRVPDSRTRVSPGRAPLHRRPGGVDRSAARQLRHGGHSPADRLGRCRRRLDRARRLLLRTPVDSLILPTASMAERYGLFIIIVLGEVVLGVVNGLLAAGDLDFRTVATGILGLTIAFGFWWTCSPTTSGGACRDRTEARWRCGSTASFRSRSRWRQRAPAW